MQNLQGAFLIARGDGNVVLVLQLFNVALHRIEGGKAKVLTNLLVGRGHALIQHEQLDELENLQFFDRQRLGQ